MSTESRRNQRVRLDLAELDARINPQVSAGADLYPLSSDTVKPSPGSVYSVSVENGLLKNDFSTDNPNAILSVSNIPVIKAQYTKAAPNSVPANALPVLTLFSNGAFNITIPSTYQTGYGDIAFQYRVTDLTNPSQFAIGTVTISVTQRSQAKLYATGAGSGSAPTVRVYAADTGLLRYEFSAYETNFTGGVRVATGDLTGDGIDDIVTAPARGGGPRIKVYDGASGILLEDFFAVDPAFRGGAYIAIGDMNGSFNYSQNGTVSTPGVKTNDLIVGAGEGGGPRVTVYSGQNINKIPIGTGGTGSTFSTDRIADFFAYDINSRAGVQVAAGNTKGFLASNPDIRDFIVTAPGLGGGPQVRIFDGAKLQNGGFGAFPPSESSYFAFSPNSRSGVNLAVGKFRPDGFADIVTGTGDGSPVVRVFDGRTNSQLREFTVPAGDSPTGAIPGTTSTGATNFGGVSGGGLVSGGGRGQERGGARIAVTDRNNDGLSDIVAAIGPGSSPRVRIFNGVSLTEIDSFVAYASNFQGGVYVGGNSL